MTPPKNNRILAQQDRQRSQELLEVYGSLLTPKQYTMTAGYCFEEKSFSQIAREQGVSRQAVHEAVRGVQRLLNYYEEKLQLKAFPREARLKMAAKGGQQDAGDPVGDAVGLLQSLKSRVRQKGIIYNPGWIVQDLSDVISVLEEGASSGPAKRGAGGGRRGRS